MVAAEIQQLYASGIEENLWSGSGRRRRRLRRFLLAVCKYRVEHTEHIRCLRLDTLIVPPRVLRVWSG